MRTWISFPIAKGIRTGDDPRRRAVTRDTAPPGICGAAADLIAHPTVRARLVELAALRQLRSNPSRRE
jgi:hypothetical protein